MREPILKVKALTKSFQNNNQEKKVLKGIDFEVYPGEVIGYLGGNGAGKSTTVKIMCGILSDYRGEISVMGIPLEGNALEIKRRVGYIPETAVMYEQLSPWEYLSFIASLYEIESAVAEAKINEYLTLFDMEGVKNHAMDSFSKGMKQKIHIISGLLNDPEIIFMDEPLNGLDANAVILMKELIVKLVGQGKTIFYCSHLMDVVEKVATRIILLDQGHIVANGTFEELRKGAEVKTLEELFSKMTRHEKIGAEPVSAAIAE